MRGQVMAKRLGAFEMRRLEALSNTIFGVAMTLLAYDLPKQKLVVATPDWHAIAEVYGSHLLALLLSFVVAGMFWYSHQRRLAYAPDGSRSAVLVNLLFLLSIILLPVTSGLYGSYLDAGDVVTIYAFNLALIATINLVLWVMAAAPRGDRPVLSAPAFSALVMILALLVAPFAPSLTRYIWPLAFVAPILASMIEGRRDEEGG
jgi:uncharacterized membrane protein